MLDDNPGFHHHVSLDNFYNSVNLWEILLRYKIRICKLLWLNFFWRSGKAKNLILYSTILTSEYEMDFSSWFASAIIVGRGIKRPEDDYINLHCHENLGPCVFNKSVIFSIVDYITVTNKIAKTRTVFRWYVFTQALEKSSNLIWDKYCKCRYEVNVLWILKHSESVRLNVTESFITDTWQGQSL